MCDSYSVSYEKLNEHSAKVYSSQSSATGLYFAGFNSISSPFFTFLIVIHLAHLILLLLSMLQIPPILMVLLIQMLVLLVPSV